MRIVLSSAGRRVGLVTCLRRALADLGRTGAVIAADAALSAPAAHLADVFRPVPRCDSTDFLPAIEVVCADHQAALIVPTIDTELPIYAAAAQRLSAAGITTAVSSPETVAIAADKRKSNAWLRSRGFPAVRQVDPETALQGVVPPPWIVKPAAGSASVGVRRIETPAELRALGPLGHGWVVEEVAPGDEYTVHVYVSRGGRVLAAVPCRRLEVRAGEVSKGLTVKHRSMIRIAREIAEALPGAWGPLNIQCFLGPDGKIRLTEINARFGGGYPLADRAGTPFARWLIEEAAGLEPDPVDDWQDDLAMLRYDDAVYLPGRSLRDREAAERRHDV